MQRLNSQTHQRGRLLSKFTDAVGFVVEQQGVFEGIVGVAHNGSVFEFLIAEPFIFQRQRAHVLEKRLLQAERQNQSRP